MRSLGELFVNNLSVGKHMNGFTDVSFVRCCQSHRADFTIDAGERLKWLYHVVGPQPMSKYQFGLRLREVRA